MLRRCAGHEAGAIVHVPSTRDLLATVPVPRPILAVRRAAGSWAAQLESLATAPYEPAGSPRKSREEAGCGITDFAHALNPDEGCALPRGRSASLDGSVRDSMDAWGAPAPASAPAALSAPDYFRKP